MTITTSSYTANSLRINIANETSSTNIITAIQQGMTKGGWTLFDSLIAGVSAGALYSPITTLVYTAPNADYTLGTAAYTTKYFIIRIDTVKLFIYTSSCESWNASTHVPTNETWSGGGVFPQGYDIKDSIILISATQRHCVLWTFIKNEPSIWSGVFEFERVAAEDTTSSASPVPNWAYTNSLMLGTPYGQNDTTTISTIMMAFCRTADGLTGARAASVYAPVSNRGMHPPNYPTGTLVISVDPNKLHLGSYASSYSSGTVTYGWDPLKTVVSPISVDAINKFMPLGRGYDIGITKPIGGPLDTVFVNIDSTGGWPNATGASSECLLLPLIGGSDYPYTQAYNTGTTSFYSPMPASTTATKVIAIGNNVWIATSTGIYTYDQTLGQGALPTLRVPHSVSGGVLDIVFDGQRTIYGSLATGIVSVDTETFNTSTISTIISGTSYLSIDGRFVYGASRTALLLPQCYSFSRTLFVTSATFIATTSTQAVTGFGTPTPDYQGNVYLASQCGIAGSGSVTPTLPIIGRYASETGVGTTFVNPKYQWTALTGSITGAAQDTVSSWYFDYTATPPKPYLFVTGGTTLVPIGAAIYEFTLSGPPSPITTSSQTAWTARATGVLQNTSAGFLYNTYDNRGDLNIVPMRGCLWVSPKKVGFIAATGYVDRIVPNHPNAVVGASLPYPGGPLIYSSAGSAKFDTVPAGFGGSVTTNGVRLFGSFTGATNSDNRVYVISGIYNPAYTSAGFSGTGRLIVKG